MFVVGVQERKDKEETAKRVAKLESELKQLRTSHSILKVSGMAPCPPLLLSAGLVAVEPGKVLVPVICYPVCVLFLTPHLCAIVCADREGSASARDEEAPEGDDADAGKPGPCTLCLHAPPCPTFNPSFALVGLLLQSASRLL